tara:strand:- start:3428 stop:3670 length:243 start_codon:yes stop_codon:yes gene_type:complete
MKQATELKENRYYMQMGLTTYRMLSTFKAIEDLKYPHNGTGGCYVSIAGKKRYIFGIDVYFSAAKVFEISEDEYKILNIK